MRNISRLPSKHIAIKSTASRSDINSFGICDIPKERYTLTRAICPLRDEKDRIRRNLYHIAIERSEIISHFADAKYIAFAKQTYRYSVLQRYKSLTGFAIYLRKILRFIRLSSSREQRDRRISADSLKNDCAGAIFLRSDMR